MVLSAGEAVLQEGDGRLGQQGSGHILGNLLVEQVQGGVHQEGERWEHVVDNVGSIGVADVGVKTALRKGISYKGRSLARDD